MTPENIHVSQILSSYIQNSQYGHLRSDVIHEAKRAWINWIACAVGASHHPTVEYAWQALKPYAGPEQAILLGRNEKTDILTATLLNGVSSHVLDFDDTHPQAMIHPSSPVAPAVLALCEHHNRSGEDLINAFVVGVEVECRIARAVLPSHYDIGWHITSTAGVFGSAAASARLCGLNIVQTQWALGLAATQASGLREMFGSMAKSLHPGKAAQNGLSSALMAQQNFTSSESGIEGKRGFAHVLSETVNLNECVSQLGERYDLLGNTYKPFACGLVLHPVIDACIELRNIHKIPLNQISSIQLIVHPKVLELTGKLKPKTGLEGKFSVYHAAAVAMVDGAGGELQFQDARVNSLDIVELRAKVSAVVHEEMPMHATRVTATLLDGKKIQIQIDDCVGSQKKPMSDEDISNKFIALCADVLGESKTENILKEFWSLEKISSFSELLS